MILSQVNISRRDAVQAGLRDGYAWHEGIWQAFPGHDGLHRQFLFRVDSRGAGFQVYVLSPVEPTVPRWGRWRSKAVKPSFLKHKSYRFQMKANPTLRQSSSRKRVGLCDEGKLRGWMVRKAKQHGFALEEEFLIVGAPTQEVFAKKQGGRRGKHIAVDFQGVLAVEDRAAFGNAFAHGIGSAKAFGFGLLMLQPLA